jgi:putative ABC transport system permease protein
VILALRELRRTPRRFVTATVVLTLLVVLLLFLGGLLDGLYLGSTGTLRAQRADVIVYSADANDSIIRSRIDPALRARVEQVRGVTDVNGLGITLVGTTVPGRSTLADTAVIGYERAPRGVPAPPARPGPTAASPHSACTSARPSASAPNWCPSASAAG